jgi:hypothetical protein
MVGITNASASGQTGIVAYSAAAAAFIASVFGTGQATASTARSSSVIGITTVAGYGIVGIVSGPPSGILYPLLGTSELYPLTGVVEVYPLTGLVENYPLSGKVNSLPLEGQTETYPLVVQV